MCVCAGRGGGGKLRRLDKNQENKDVISNNKKKIVQGTIKETRNIFGLFIINLKRNINVAPLLIKIYSPKL